MKKYEKAKIIAKNLPSGSYAAGCPAKQGGGCGHSLIWAGSSCRDCERTK